MPITFNDFSGMETAAKYEHSQYVAGTWDTTQGAPGHNGGIEGSQSLLAGASGISSAGAAIQDFIIFGGYFSLDTLSTLGTKWTTPFIVSTDAADGFKVEFDVNGDFRLVDSTQTTVATFSTGLAIKTWYFLEARCDMLSSGNIKIWIREENGNETVVADLGGDFSPSSGTDIVAALQGAATGEKVRHFSYYLMNGSTAESDRLKRFEVLYYTGGEENSNVPDDGGDNLSSGTVWKQMFALPYTGISNAKYAGTSALAGAVDADTEGGGRSCDGPGPAGDGRIDDYSQILAAQYHCRGIVDNAIPAATFDYGNDGGAASDINTIALPFVSKGTDGGVRISYPNMSDAAHPGASERFRLGMTHPSFFGSYDVTMIDTSAALLHQPDEVVGGFLGLVGDDGGAVGQGGMLCGSGGGLVS